MLQGLMHSSINRLRKFTMTGIFLKRNIFYFCKNKKFIENIGCRCFASDTRFKVEQIKNNRNLKNGPGLKEFLVAGKNLPAPNSTQILSIENHPYLDVKDFHGNNRNIHFEVYGCQMNVNDTEVVWSILKDSGYIKVEDVREADVILVITCAVREGAEAKIWNRLKHLTAMKKNRSHKKPPLQIGVLGCMAERLKTELLEKEQWVDIVAGPDSYKDLPRLLAITKSGQSAVNVLLSLEETYADIMPVRLTQNAVTSFVSIMRGCDNMCSYCIVPFTRGKERSRPLQSIENEVKQLMSQGVKEITLLGQNVNSYRDITTTTQDQVKTNIVPGFKTVYKDKIGGVRFAKLLERCAVAAPDIRFRFTSPHPKDFPDEVLEVVKAYGNICKSLHLPAQSGNSSVLERMRRGYTRDSYLSLVERIRTFLPKVALSSDFICGFCGESDDEFSETLSLIREVKYNVAYLFAYSMREKTTAHRRLKDDVPADVKNARLRMMVETYRDTATELQAKFIGEEQIILVEGRSKRSPSEVFGRNDANLKVIIPAGIIPVSKNSVESKLIKPGDFIVTKIIASNSQILKGTPLYQLSKLSDYSFGQ